MVLTIHGKLPKQQHFFHKVFERVWADQGKQLSRWLSAVAPVSQ